MSCKVSLSAEVIVLTPVEAGILEEKFLGLVHLAGWRIMDSCYWEEIANRDELVIKSRVEYRAQVDGRS